MKHYRDEVKEKEAEAPAGRSERRQQHEDPDWDRPEHPKKARKLVSLVNMSQAGNDTKYNGDGVACFAFRCFSCATSSNHIGHSVVASFGRRCPQYGQGILSPALGSGRVAGASVYSTLISIIEGRTRGIRQANLQLAAIERFGRIGSKD